MALTEIDELIQHVASTSDVGEDTDGSEAFRFIESQISGDETSWAEVESASFDLLRKTADVRIAVSLVGASLRDPQSGLSGFSRALTLLRTLLEVHGARAHPQVDPESPAPALRLRAMTIDELGSPFGTPGDEFEIVARIRLLPLTSQGEVFTFRDLMILRGELANVKIPDEEKSDRQLAFDAAMAQTADRDRGRLETLLEDAHRSLHEVEEIERVFAKSAADPADAPRLELDGLKEQIRRVMTPIEEVIGSSSQLGQGADASEQSALGHSGAAGASPSAMLDQEGSPVTTGPMKNGSIQSRADVLVAIQGIKKYYRENEPSSPVPLLLDRASRFVSMNFVDIVEDIAGESVENLQILFGATASDSDDASDMDEGESDD